MVMLPETELGELARLLQQHTPMCLLSDMQVRAALELMQQRGWKIARAADASQVAMHGHDDGHDQSLRLGD
jgi:hypothetical protein